jgi:outer membrane protein OmpA-like peptidoglycan-associated protein
MHEPPQHRPALAQRSPAARRPWASRAEDSAPLAVWHRLATSPPTLQRKASDEEPPKMTVSGDSERKSPTGGVAVRDGTLDWELKYSGKDTEAHAGEGMSIGITLGEDVTFLAHFSPSPGASTCPTITFTQTVKPTIGGLWDTGPLLYTRSAASGASADVLHEPSRPETEPFYGADPSASGPGLEATRTRTIAGTRAGASAKASLDDAPYRRYVPKGTTAVRQFESAAVCVESAETFGSIAWGYSKTGDGVITLLGGTLKDVRTAGASAEFEPTRKAFYSGFFQLSLGDFGVGSSVLTAAHETALAAVDTKDLMRAILVGANDNSGGAEASADLSLKRADAAKDHLVKKRGVSASLVRTEGHGVEAREPNPPGVKVGANRRVDVHLQRGAEGARPAHAVPGSGAEAKRLRAQNPRRTVDEAVDLIVDLDTRTGSVSGGEWLQLSEMLTALDQWRAVDTTVPDLRVTHREALARIKGRTPMAKKLPRAPMPPTGPISPEVDEALRRYEEAKRRLEQLKRERDEALRRLDAEKRELLEEE